MKTLLIAFITFLTLFSLKAATHKDSVRKSCRDQIKIFFGSDYTQFQKRLHAIVRRQVKAFRSGQFEEEKKVIAHAYASMNTAELNAASRINMVYSLRPISQLSYDEQVKNINLFKSNIFLIDESSHEQALTQEYDWLQYKEIANLSAGGLFTEAAQEIDGAIIMKPFIVMKIPEEFENTELEDLIFLHEYAHYLQWYHLIKHDEYNMNLLINDTPLGKELRYYREYSSIFAEISYVGRIPRSRRLELIDEVTSFMARSMGRKMPPLEFLEELSKTIEIENLHFTNLETIARDIYFYSVLHLLIRSLDKNQKVGQTMSEQLLIRNYRKQDFVSKARYDKYDLDELDYLTSVRDSLRKN